MNAYTKILCLFIVAFGVQNLHAQSDTIIYEQGLPITGEIVDRRDSVDHPPYTNRNIIAEERLPTRVVKRLDGDKLFDGWRKGKTEFDENLKQYWIYIPNKESVRLYVMSKEGDVVRVDERNTATE